LPLVADPSSDISSSKGNQSGIAELCKVRREYPVVVGYELFHVCLEARNQ
jgi:hypothetical protein